MKEEWRSIRHSAWTKVVLIAIAIIPMVYAGVFLGSMWDPYGNASNIPVAVVNQDQSVQYNDVTLSLGKTLCNGLKQNKAMNFQFVNDETAEKGLKDGNYYMVITIPNDFSYKATTLLNKNPEKMVLKYTTNPGTNYIASKMDESAIKTIKESVSANVTETYADALFSQVQTLSDGLQEASDGENQMIRGVDQTMDGNKSIEEHLDTLANSTLTFVDGTIHLKDGLRSYVQGVEQLSNGSQQLEMGLQTLNEKSSVLSASVNQLDIGATAMSIGVDKYTKGVSTIANGITQLNENSNRINAGMLEVTDGLTQTKDGSLLELHGMQQLSYQLSQHLSDQNKAMVTQVLTENQNIESQNKMWVQTLSSRVTNHTASDEDKELLAILEKNTAILDQDSNTLQSLTTGLSDVQQVVDSQLLPGMQQLNDGVSKLENAVNHRQGLKQGILTYTNGVNELSIGIHTLQESSSTLQSGAAHVSQGMSQMKEHMPDLTQGVEQLSQGSNALYTGSNALVKSNGNLLNGMEQLNDGSKRIANGASQLASGSNALGKGLSLVHDGGETLGESLHAGAQKSKLNTTEKTKSMLAQPLTIEHKEISKVETNGKAMAPYMMSVGLYVACMAFTLMYPLLKNNSRTSSGFKLWFSKATVMYAVSTIMACMMVTALILINGLAPLETMKTFLMAVLIAAAFMSMIVFFNITLGKIGAFLVLIFMVFQLGGAAGTYPIETSNHLYQIIHPFMPFTYSVDAFRHTLAIGGNITMSIGIFIGMILVFSTLSMLFYHWKTKIGDVQYEKTILAHFH